MKNVSRKLNTCRFFRLGILAVILAMASIVQAQKFEDLKLNVTPSSERILIGEPLTLNVKVTNPTQSPIMAHRSLRADVGMIDVVIASPKRAAKRYLGPRWGLKGIFPRPAKIAAGETLSTDISIFFNSKNPGQLDVFSSTFPFDKPGKYQISVSWLNLSLEKAISSPVVNIEVVEPLNNEAEVWKKIQSDQEIASFLQHSNSANEEIVEQKIVPLVEKYPSTAHAYYLMHKLGKYYFRKGDFPKSINYLERASQSPPNTDLRLRAISELLLAYVFNKDFDKAEKLYDSSRKDFVGTNREKNLSANWNEAKRLIEEFETLKNQN